MHKADPKSEALSALDWIEEEGEVRGEGSLGGVGGGGLGVSG